MKNLLLLVLIWTCTVQTIIAQEFVIDSNYGENGIVTHAFENFASSQPLAHLDDGSIITSTKVVNGRSVVKFNPQGLLDSTFQLNFIHPERTDYLIGMEKQIDDKIVFGFLNVDSLFILLYRIDPDGNLDKSFGEGGVAKFFKEDLGIVDSVLYRKEKLKISPNGDIIIGLVVGEFFGEKVIQIYCIDTDGNLKLSFGDSGHTEIIEISGSGTNFFNFNLLNDGSIIVAAPTIIIKLNSEGQKDTSFGNEGITSLDFYFSINEEIKGIHPLNNDKILFIKNYVSKSVSFFRLDQNGNIDTTYYENGFKELDSDFKYKIVDKIQFDNGNITILGSSNFDSDNENFIMQLDSDGMIKQTFDNQDFQFLDLRQELSFLPQYIGSIKEGEAFVSLDYASTFNIYNNKISIIKLNNRLNVNNNNLDNNKVLSASLSPNPCRSFTNLSYELKTKKSISIVILNSEGKTVQNIISNQEKSAGAYVEQIPIETTLPKGIYYVSIFNEKDIHSLKLLKIE